MSATASRAGGADLLRRASHEVRRTVLVLFLIGAASNLLGLVVPFFSMEAFNRVATSRNLNTLVWLAVGLVVGLAVLGALEFLRSLLQIALGRTFLARLNLPTLIAAAQDGGPEAPPPGQAIRDLNQLHGFISGPAVIAPFDLVWSPILLVALFAMHWAYGALALGCVVILVALSTVNEVLTKRPLAEANEETARAFGEIAGTVRHAEAVKALGMLPALSARWQRSQDRMLARLGSALRTSKALYAATKSLRLLMTAAMVTLGLVLSIKGEASGGSMLAGNMILSKLLLPFEQIAGSWRQWIYVRKAWERVHTLLNRSRTLRDTIALPVPQAKLAADRVVYIPAGHDRPVLRGVSFRVDPGEALGIIGPSGSGKSTLGRLLLGVLQPTSGGVYLDGHSTFLWERGDFGRHVGYLPQKVTLLDGTVGENIARMRQAPAAEVIEAARKAGLHETIMALPNGYATQVAEAGFVLSGGQRQRLALARALFGAPRLLVLDEPNSSLDQDGESVVVEAIAAAKAAGAAVVVIAHRPSVLAAVDKLLVLKEGMVDRFGAREAVMKALAAPPVRLLRAAESA